MIERKQIENFPKYEVSNVGDIRRIGKNFPLKQTNNTSGYKRVTIYGYKKKVVEVHRIVASAFCERNGFNVVNHIDGNKTNNIYSNLERCTHQHNNREAYRLGLIKPSRARKGIFGKDHNTSKTILQYKGSELIKERGSSMDIKRELGYDTGSISRACKLGNKAYGYTWKHI